MLIEILNLALSGFWNFVGVALILAIPFNFVIALWSKFMKMLCIRSRGYPPSHCDAIGKPFEDEDEDEDE